MIRTAYELGMYTSFTNASGTNPHHSDVYSTAILVREFIYRFPDILRITRMPYMYFNGQRFNNTNRLLRGSTMPVDGVDGFKTGSLRVAGWNHSITAIRDGRRIIAVVMGAVNRDTAMREGRILVEFGFEELVRRDTARAERVRIFHNGQLLPLTTPAVVEGGRLMLPLYAIFRPLGFGLTWDDTYRVATAEHATLGHSTIFVDRQLTFIRNAPATLRTVPRLIGSRVFVPLEFIEMATDTTATWCMDTGVVNFVTSSQTNR
jgi:hypothetical protein